MRAKFLTILAICGFAATSLYGQAKGFTGKWGTDAAIARARGAGAPPEAGARGGGGAIMADLKVDASNKVTGQVTEFGNALCGNPDTVLTIESGMVDGKMITFQVTRPNCPATPGAAAAPGGTGVTWTGTLSDDEQTVTAARAIAGGGRGGRGGRGGGGAGAGGQGGGAQAPAGGAQAGPTAQPPAGGAPQGDGGGAGGQGGRGGRGGRGGGGQIILHRMP